MKVLIYTENYEPGGGNRYLVDFINTLDRNDDIYLYSNKGGIGTDVNLINYEVATYEVEIASLLKIRNWINFRKSKKDKSIRFKITEKLIRNKKIEYALGMLCSYINQKKFSRILDNNYNLIIIFNGGFPGGFSCFDLATTMKRKKCKVAMSIVSMPMNIAIVEKKYKSILKKIDAYIVNCEEIKHTFSEESIIDKNKIHVLYNCVEKIETKKNILPIDENRKIILGYIGRIEYFKGIYVLLDALKILLDNHFNCMIRLVGKIIEREEIEKKIKDLSIEDNIEFVGYYSGDINDCFLSFDALVFPSLWEGFPYTLLEAMRLGLPVVSTDVGGISELIIHEKNGFLVEKNNPEKFAKAIEELFFDENRLHIISNNAYNTIKDNFLFENFKRGSSKIIEMIMEK